tara:strand:+ start:171 stop:887 length:717 start_codon:yes stop_codon:yes gene_type:complete
MSLLNVDKIDPQSGTALEVGTSGDTVTVPSGVGLTLTNSTLLLPTTINTDKIDPKSGTDLEIGSSGDTITIPSGATITNSGTATGFGGGKLGQVVSTALKSTVTSTSTTYVDVTGLTVDITPTATDSKVLVQVSMNVEAENGYISSIKLVRDSTDIVGDAAGDRDRGTFWVKGHYTATMYNQAILYLDSPATTSAVTYKLQWLIESGGTYALNRTVLDQDTAGRPRNLSTITVMEILA